MCSSAVTMSDQAASSRAVIPRLMAVPFAPTRLGSLVEQHRDQILAVVRAHQGGSIAVFGSVARGEAGPDSDIDLLVELAPGAPCST